MVSPDFQIEPEPKDVRAIAIRSAAAELEQIANNFENWAKKEHTKYIDPNGAKPPAFTLAQIEDWVNTYLLKQRLVAVFFSHPHLSYDENSGLTPFLTTYEHKEFQLIIDVFRLYMPAIANSLKELYDEFWESVTYHIKCYERSKKVQQENIPSIGESIENTFWHPPLFLDGTVVSTIKRLRHLAKIAKGNLATIRPAETTDDQYEVTPTPQPDSILGETWNLCGIPINVKKLRTKLKSHPIWLILCFLVIVLIATHQLWWPLINKIAHNSSAKTDIHSESKTGGDSPLAVVVSNIKPVLEIKIDPQKILTLENKGTTDLNDISIFFTSYIFNDIFSNKEPVIKEYNKSGGSIYEIPTLKAKIGRKSFDLTKHSWIKIYERPADQDEHKNPSISIYYCFRVIYRDTYTGIKYVDYVVTSSDKTPSMIENQERVGISAPNTKMDYMYKIPEIIKSHQKVLFGD
jgi:hypothetical protein